MEFISTKNFDSEAERVVWDAIKQQFKHQPGYCWHRYLNAQAEKHMVGYY